MRVAVVCEDLVMSGGLLRFERFGRVARSLGHELVFVISQDDPQRDWTPTGPTLTWSQAAEQTWDATMVPGAGFSDSFVAQLSELRADAWGTRIQHVLNDRVRESAFLAVYRAFDPHRVVVNNRHWTREDLAAFNAASVHLLEGAVDSAHFAGLPARPQSAVWTIGGLANKQPKPLIDAIRNYGRPVQLRLYGDAAGLPDVRDLIESGRLVLVGILEDSELPAFYARLDCVVHTETMAGWANLAAEALAASLPLVCTESGTLAFARDDVTALVVQPTAAAIVLAVQRLQDDPALVRRLVRNGRTAVAHLGWEPYAQALLDLVPRPAVTAVS